MDQEKHTKHGSSGDVGTSKNASDFVDFFDVAVSENGREFSSGGAPLENGVQENGQLEKDA